MLLLSLWTFQLGGREWTVSLAVAIAAVVGWMALDLGIGVAMALLMAVAWFAAEALAGALGSASAVWMAFTALFVGGWVLQFVGHHYEGKRPALLDNIFQAFIGPMFLVAGLLNAATLAAAPCNALVPTAVLLLPLTRFSPALVPIKVELLPV